tara:strand:+ start:1392 stop:1520 length:129 start_codon:yes stop_codon:yes gene_type:complete
VNKNLLKILMNPLGEANKVVKKTNDQTKKKEEIIRKLLKRKK